MIVGHLPQEASVARSRPQVRNGLGRVRQASPHRPTRGARRKRGSHALSPRQRARAGWATNGRRGAGVMELPTVQAVVGCPPRPRPVPLTAAGIGVSSDARRRPETRPLRPLAATKLPDGLGSQRPARRRFVRTVDSLAGGWSPAAAARSGRWSASGAVRRVGTAGNRAPGTSAPSEGLKRTGQPAAGTMPAWRNNQPRGRWPVDQRPPHDLSAVAAAPRAGAEGRKRRFKIGLNSRSEQGPVLWFFRRPAGRSCGEEKPLQVCRLANGVWWAEREAAESSRRRCPAGGDSRSRPATPSSGGSRRPNRRKIGADTFS